MKRFIIFVISFLIPILLLGVVLEVFIRKIPNDYISKADYLNKNANTIETLILGSSHALYGVNPDYLNGIAYNASFVSQTPDLDLAILKQYESEFQSLKNVVIRLSYATLFEKLSDTSEDWRLKDYNLYFNLKQDYKFKYNSELLSVKLKTNLKRLYNYYILEESEQNISEHGWGINSGLKPPNDLDEAGKKAAIRHTADDFEWYKENTMIFEEIAEFCQQGNIKLIVVTFPTISAYGANMKKDQFEKTLEYGKFLETEYSNCRYYNFLNHPIFETEDFFDGDHLNAQGAKKMTDLINTVLN
ncbi:hypothetical protein [Formosa sp. S-31]|uniref:hypothetical protein n=1 Tax=Formosa sp. S-31 TaxID=2790949 RepID=UPI003EBF983B